MFLSEIFYSLQGEGSLIGTPSLFIRTSGCNLRCHWCDTPYASWYPEGTHYGIEQIIRELKASPAQHVVITGGEPLLARELAPLSAALHHEGYHITIETAGTLPPPSSAQEFHCDLVSLSPKLNSSAPSAEEHPQWHQRHQARRYQPSFLKKWITNYPYQLKFVITSAEQIEEIEAMLEEIEATDKSQIFLMPEGIERSILEQRQQWLAPLCQEKGFRFGPRLHIALYGNQRGT